MLNTDSRTEQTIEVCYCGAPDTPPHHPHRPADDEAAFDETDRPPYQPGKEPPMTDPQTLRVAINQADNKVNRATAELNTKARHLYYKALDEDNAQDAEDK